ncbi:hypothetical protein [Plesiomonas shigelloides]|uniref:hypothetical protein n=1 Tax=Plesiomonas shigelloides TaxID=703 RepID=UPI00387F2EB8
MNSVKKVLFSFCIFFVANNLFAHDQDIKSIALSNEQIKQVILYGKFTGQHYIGKVFNQNSNIVLTQITIEAIPQDETNIFNDVSPRFFNAELNVKPRVMSEEFNIETGALNPDFHKPKIKEAKGYFQE